MAEETKPAAQTDLQPDAAKSAPQQTGRKAPSAGLAVCSFLAIVAVLVVLINLGVDTTMSLFVATIMAAIVAFSLKIPWPETESVLLKTVADCIPTFVMVIMVGMLVGIWIAMACDECLRGALFTIRFRRGKWKEKRLVSDSTKGT